MIASELPNRPSSKLAADLFQYKSEHYLLIVDYFSMWPEIHKLIKYYLLLQKANFKIWIYK